MSTELSFQLVMPNVADAELIREWRNDPVALAMSCTYTQPKTLETFFPEFLRSYFSYAALPALFADMDGKRVGLLRFDPAEKEGDAEVSLLVAPEWRKKGLGVAILQALEPFLVRQGIECIVARIKKENFASIKTFTNAGYVHVGGGEEALVFHRKLGNLKLKKVFIIAEAGSNWRAGTLGQDLERGLALIEEAKKAGADAVKFQTFRAEDTYVSQAGSANYLRESGITKEIGELFKELEMPVEMIPKLAQKCQQEGIEFMSSVFSARDFALIDPYVKRHKIASYEISHLRLLELAARSGKPLILSTGAANQADIDWAVDTFRKNGGRELTLLQCTAKYPAPAAAMHLNTLAWFKDRYQVEVGLSDHSFNPLSAPLAAVALGAKVIEKHFTLKRSLPGPDHSFALEPKELKQMIDAVREVEEMKGSPLKSVQTIEQDLYLFARRGIQALRDIKLGEILNEGANIAILRPGKQKLGLHPKHLAEVEGKPAKRFISSGEGIQKGDV